MNWYGIQAIYRFEMARWGRTFGQSIIEIDGVSYGAFIVPGLIMLMLLTESISNASFGIYFPRYAGAIYELLSAPISSFEATIGYVGAAATKSMIIGLIILATSNLFVDVLNVSLRPDVLET